MRVNSGLGPALVAREWIDRLAGLLGPVLMETPPKVGSRRPGDLLDQIRFVLRRRKGMDVRTVADVTKLFTMSAADLLREWFESPELLGLQAVNGIIGTWAGPEEPGTAYVLMHHSVGEEAEGQVSSWGYPEGGMGAVADACRRSAESFGAEIRVNAKVDNVIIRNGRAVGVEEQWYVSAKNGVLRVDASRPQAPQIREHVPFPLWMSSRCPRCYAFEDSYWLDVGGGVLLTERPSVGGSVMRLP